ncbi:hypothetical protein JB92DRAFT_2835938 [Gautieria morchelliformis]|nr:hypothetical protein JB92DRAFT_2835938 [Gautieria morchelliformis]
MSGTISAIPSRPTRWETHPTNKLFEPKNDLIITCSVAAFPARAASPTRSDSEAHPTNKLFEPQNDLIATCSVHGQDRPSGQLSYSLGVPSLTAFFAPERGDPIKAPRARTRKHTQQEAVEPKNDRIIITCSVPSMWASCVSACAAPSTRSHQSPTRSETRHAQQEAAEPKNDLIATCSSWTPLANSIFSPRREVRTVADVVQFALKSITGDPIKAPLAWTRKHTQQEAVKPKNDLTRAPAPALRFSVCSECYGPSDVRYHLDDPITPHSLVGNAPNKKPSSPSKNDLIIITCSVPPPRVVRDRSSRFRAGKIDVRIRVVADVVQFAFNHLAKRWVLGNGHAFLTLSTQAPEPKSCLESLASSRPTRRRRTLLGMEPAPRARIRAPCSWACALFLESQWPLSSMEGDLELPECSRGSPTRAEWMFAECECSGDMKRTAGTIDPKAAKRLVSIRSIRDMKRTAGTINPKVAKRLVSIRSTRRHSYSLSEFGIWNLGREEYQGPQNKSLSMQAAVSECMGNNSSIGVIRRKEQITRTLELFKIQLFSRSRNTTVVLGVQEWERYGRPDAVDGLQGWDGRSVTGCDEMRPSYGKMRDRHFVGGGHLQAGGRVCKSDNASISGRSATRYAPKLREDAEHFLGGGHLQAGRRSMRLGYGKMRVTSWAEGICRQVDEVCAQLREDAGQTLLWREGICRQETTLPFRHTFKTTTKQSQSYPFDTTRQGSGKTRTNRGRLGLLHYADVGIYGAGGPKGLRTKGPG